MARFNQVIKAFVFLCLPWRELRNQSQIELCCCYVTNKLVQVLSYVYTELRMYLGSLERNKVALSRSPNFPRTSIHNAEHQPIRNGLMALFSPQFYLSPLCSLYSNHKACFQAIFGRLQWRSKQLGKAGKNFSK